MVLNLIKDKEFSILKKTLLLYLLLCSCAQFDFLKKNTENESIASGLWKVKSIWVKPLPLKPNYGFKKVNRFTPYVYENTLVAASSIDGLSALDIKTKKVLWNLEIPHGVEAPPVGVNDRLFFGAQNGIFYSVNISTGSIIWKFDTESELLAEPLLADGKVYFSSGSNIVYCLDALTGRQIWIYNRQESYQLMTLS